MPPPRRKKWTEEEERTLIDKYEELLSDGTLSKMKTREKKFRPIAALVNSLHHSRDPVAFPWQWSWKDASTKVQNMRHQYLLVKQKIKKPLPTDDHLVVGPEEEEEEQFDWGEGLTHWPNFLRYKSVFGDVPLVGLNDSNNNTESVGLRSNNFVVYEHLNGGGEGGEDGFGVELDGCENGVLGLGFEYDGEEAEDHHHHVSNSNNNNNNTNTSYSNDHASNGNGNGNGNVNVNVNVNVNGNGNGNGNGNDNGHPREQQNGDEEVEYEEIFPSSSSQLRKKRKRLKGLEKQTWVFLANQFAKLKEREARFEQREAERERERVRREQVFERGRKWKLDEWEKEREDREKKRREWMREWEVMEKESVERERRRKEEDLMMERDWEQRMEQRMLNWNKRISDMLSQHRVAMDQIHSRILHDQQSLTNQLLTILSQWTGHPTGLPDHAGAGNPYLSQMIQNLHHVNGIVHSENRVDEDNPDDQFIVDDG